jgi:hypothetical protein
MMCADDNFGLILGGSIQPTSSQPLQYASMAVFFTATKRCKTQQQHDTSQTGSPASQAVTKRAKEAKAANMSWLQSTAALLQASLLDSPK